MKSLSTHITESLDTTVNEATVDLHKYVQDVSKKTFKGGGNGQNLLDNALDLANHIDSYQKGRSGFGEDGFYEAGTVSAFKKLVDSMSADDIKNNNIDDMMESNNVNEAVEQYSPEIEKELMSLLALAIKKLDITNVKGIRQSSWGRPLPVIHYYPYKVVNTNWVAAQFFNEKSAKSVASMLSANDISALSKSGDPVYVEKETMTSFLEYSDLLKIISKKGISVNTKRIEEIIDSMTVQK